MRRWKRKGGYRGRDFELLLNVSDHPVGVCDRFNKAGNQEKREILGLLGSTPELFDKKLRIVVPNELLGFKNVYEKLGDDLGRFDTKKALDIQGLSGQKRATFTNLCAGRDSNPRRPKPFGLQPNAIDHSATDACYKHRY